MDRQLRKELREYKNKHKYYKQRKARYRKLLPSFITMCFFAALLFVLAMLKNSAKVNEFMVTKVSRWILMIMGKTTSAFPFSMYELFLYIVIAAVILNLIHIIFLLVRRRLAPALSVFMSMAIVALIVANIYYISAGYSYNRYEPYFPFYNPALNKQQTVEITEYFIDDFNAISQNLEYNKDGASKMPYSTNQLSHQIRKEYLRHTGYNINEFTPRSKIMLSSAIMSEMRFTGVFFAPFGESNINGKMPAHQMPFTMAHEIAHAKGVMREDDADELALYICLTSEDEYLRYSAYAEMIYTLLDAVWTWESLEGSMGRPQYTRLVAKIDPKIKADMAAADKYWASLDKLERFNNLIDAIYNKYLQLMGQQEGINAYIPPTTEITEQPKIDPDTGLPAIDPGTGQTVTERKPYYTIIQMIFFQAHLEKEGDILAKDIK